MSAAYLQAFLDFAEDFPFDIQHDVTAVRELDEHDYSLPLSRCFCHYIVLQTCRFRLVRALRS
jgi:hypothetical protein